MHRIGNRAAGGSIVEILIAVALTPLVVGTVLQICRTGDRMGNMATGAGVAAAAAFLEAQLASDLAQVGVDPAQGRVFQVRGSSISFYRASFQPGVPGPLQLRPVCYEIGSSVHGLETLKRTDGRGTRVIPGLIMRSSQFYLTPLPRGFLFHFASQLLDGDDPRIPSTPGGSRSLPVKIVIPVRICEEIASPGLARALALRVDGEL